MTRDRQRTPPDQPIDALLHAMGPTSKPLIFALARNCLLALGLAFAILGKRSQNGAAFAFLALAAASVLLALALFVAEFLWLRRRAQPPARHREPPIPTPPA
ncbi:MAG: hypothetical protein JXR37_37205 [Kiritimatiellae bacterium]|nr:hypothetical protein [Kiritimatiellia bacterium]